MIVTYAVSRTCSFIEERVCPSTWCKKVTVPGFTKGIWGTVWLVILTQSDMKLRYMICAEDLFFSDNIVCEISHYGYES
jgi:hypothetical protein